MLLSQEQTIGFVDRALFMQSMRKLVFGLPFSPTVLVFINTCILKREELVLIWSELWQLRGNAREYSKTRMKLEVFNEKIYSNKVLNDRMNAGMT